MRECRVEKRQTSRAARGVISADSVIDYRIGADSWVLTPRLSFSPESLDSTTLPWPQPGDSLHADRIEAQVLNLTCCSLGRQTTRCGGKASSIQLESDYADTTVAVDVMTSTRPSATFGRSPSILTERRDLRRSSGFSVSSRADPEQTPDTEDAQDTQPTAITEEISEVKRYEDFTTIDWIQDAVYEQSNRRAKRRGGGGFWDQEGVFGWRRKMRESYDAGQAWLVVTLVGIAIGVNSALLNIITEWLSDIKLGHCTTAFYLNEQFCCWGAEGGMLQRILQHRTQPKLTCISTGCPEWKHWTGFWPFNYVVYFFFAVWLATLRPVGETDTQAGATCFHRGCSS